MKGFLELFGEYIDSSVSAYFGEAVVESIEAALSDRSVSMVVRFPVPVDISVIRKTKADLARVMNLKKLDFGFHFPPESFDMNYLSSFVREIYDNFPASKTILDGAEYSLDGDKLTVRLASNGKDVLTNLGCDEFIRKTVDRRFERLISVEFMSSASEADDLQKLEKRP